LLVLAPGAMLLTREARADRRSPATESEVAALIERDLSHWLARQAGPDGAVILAPPNLTTSLIYHGGLSGLGTPFWENKAGFVASMRIAAASSPDEAQALAQKRNLGYIVMPSWDDFLEEYARQGAADVQQTFVAFIQTWRPPRWLRPIPYHIPNVAGFEGQSVAIFRSIEVQDNATALSYLAEYFVELGMMREAAAVAYTLERSYPADLGAAVARALVARARKDVQAFGEAIDGVQAALARDEGEDLAWDRRVSLAIALVDADLLDQAREEVKRCLVEIDEPRLRSLTTVSLHRLLVMTRTFGLKIDNPSVSSLAQQLLPIELRGNQ
jgi:tetratricopeptide (TPR) repeat protein